MNKSNLLILDFFAGKGSVWRVAKTRMWERWDTWATDIEPYPGIDVVMDIFDLELDTIPQNPDVAWFSPPCQAFSVASISHHWAGGKGAYIPKTVFAAKSINILRRVQEIIEYIQPKKWYIENPRGVLRKLDVMQFAPIRHTVTYCQYGDNRMKPTDIWTNDMSWSPRPMCKNGAPCHEAAPRGSRTGTQGIKSAIDRAAIPEDLIIELLDLYAPESDIHIES